MDPELACCKYFSYFGLSYDEQALNVGQKEG